jgi:hypothetical protein
MHVHHSLAFSMSRRGLKRAAIALGGRIADANAKLC